MVTVIQASPTIQRFAPASCFGRIPVTSPLLILLHINEDCYLIKRLTRGLDKGLKEGLQNKRRMNSFRGTPCVLKNSDAAPSVPVHIRLGRYAGGSPYGSQSPPPPTGEDRGLANRADWCCPARKVTQESVAHLCLKCNGQSPRLQSSGEWHDVGSPFRDWY